MQLQKKLRLTIMAFALFVSISTYSQEVEKIEGIPIWVSKDWAQQTQGSGTWIAENSKKSDKVPYDAYGMKWIYGPGKTTIKGRLYAIKDGKDVYTLWEFLTYWDPEKKKVLTVQHGYNPGLGNLALGESFKTENESMSKSVSKVFKLNGDIYYVGHKSEIKNDELHSRSYKIENGKWKSRGYFVWKLLK